MATLKRELREILERYSIDPRDKSKLWDCHGTLVLYHRAYEIIAAQEGIIFDPPTIIESNGADKIVALLVTGRMKERAEWSIGEAAPGNSKNAYPYAIAEKRAKDRVVAKLVGLAEHVYSEDEADDFRAGGSPVVTDNPYQPPAPPAGERNAAPPPSPPTNGHTPPAARADDAQLARAVEIKDRIKAAIENAEEPKIIEQIIKVNGADLKFVRDFHSQTYTRLLELATARSNELRGSA